MNDTKQSLIDDENQFDVAILGTGIASRVNPSFFAALDDSPYLGVR